jgi:carbon monoxide dehydrogenase subunit G
MSASIKSEFTLPANPKSVFEMLIDPDFLAAKVKLAKSGDFTLSGTSPNLQILVNRTVEADFPPIVKKFVGENLVVNETQSWKKDSENHYSATFNLEIPNAPVEITGEIKVFGKSEATVSITGQVKVNIPIFGAAAEPNVVNEITKVLADEESLCRSWINKYK